MPLFDRVIHIGPLDREEPRKDFGRVPKFFESGGKRLTVVLWDSDDIARHKPLTGPNSDVEILEWRPGLDDMRLTNTLMETLPQVVGVRVETCLWYSCGEHTTPRSGETVEKCPECGKAALPVIPYRAEQTAFANIFTRVINLANFDTRSGDMLLRFVNPMRNMFLNMKHALASDEKHWQAKDLKGAGRGKSAIVVGAGPHLDSSIPALRRLASRGDVLILCVGRSCRKLLEHGIRVDYVTSVEMFDWDGAIFENMGDVGKTCLCYATVCAPTTVENWPGPKLCMWDAETANMLGRTDWIMGGNSVSHHTLNFACQILDCDEVVLVGQDLAYTVPNKTHADGTEAPSWPEEVKEIDRAYHEGDIIWAPCTAAPGADLNPECHRSPVGIGQGAFLPSRIVEVRTSQPYVDFATLFAMLIQKHGKKVYNACGNGQKIEGTEYLNLETWKA